jgi:tetratricopeptide (TPR) repeat protein
VPAIDGARGAKYRDLLEAHGELFMLGRKARTVTGATVSQPEQHSFAIAGRRLTLPTWRTIGIAAAAVVVVALIGIGVWFWSAAREQRGAAAYAEVLMRARPTENPQAPAEAREAAIRDLEQVLAEHPANGMAPQAAYLLGNLRFASHQYDRARAAYQIASARAGGGTIATLARAGVGYTWEAEKKLPEATQAFEAALAEVKPSAFYYEELLVALGRVQDAAGKKDAAIATYRRLLKDVPRSTRAAETRQRLAVLGAAP